VANWTRDFLERNPGAQIVKRARHALHVREGGRNVAYITGAPCHYWDGTEWQPLDTEPQWDGVHWRCPGLDVTIAEDGTVRLGDYSQLTRRVGLFRPSTMQLLGTRNVPLGSRLGDALIAEGDWWRVERRITEIGYREWLTLKEQPSIPQAKAGDFLVLETVVTSVILPNGWVDDKYDISTHWSPAPVAWDANGQPLTCRRYWHDGTLYTGIPVTELAGATYPVVIDPDFQGDTADGYVTGSGDSARDTSVSFDTSSTTAKIGQTGGMTEGGWEVSRTYLKFDTSSIGAGQTVTQVNLRMVCTYDGSFDAEFDIQIVKQDWSAQDPITNDNREAAFDNCLSGTADDSIWRNTNGISTNTQYTSGNLDTSWVEMEGTTYYSLRSSRDKDNTGWPGQFKSERIDIAMQEHATEAYRPVLIVAYEAGGPPAITGTGTFAAQPVTIAGAGTYTPLAITGTGSVAVQPVALAGTGTYTPLAITGTGSVETQPAAIAGTGTYTPQAITGEGAIEAQLVALAGTGTVGAAAITGTGSLAAQPVAIAGIGTYTPLAITGTGSIATQAVTIAGTGTYTPLAITGTGSIATQPPAIAGTGTIGTTAITGTGAVAVQPITIAGTGIYTPLAITGTGGVIAQPVQIAGVGMTTGVLARLAIMIAARYMAGIEDAPRYKIGIADAARYNVSIEDE